ncbi:MAG: class I SAM-dependent methyltransferase, partial [Alphaproteobacteria bacterium]
PYLRFKSEPTSQAERVIAAMPAAQGIIHWPKSGPNQTVLVEEEELPFPDNSMDRIVLVHAVENSEHLRLLLREVWRVLTDSGRLIVVVPNRSGLWALSERTPFGHGRPFTATQLSRLLRDSLFTPTNSVRALFVPPVRSRMVLGGAGVWEKIGNRWFPQLGGLHVMEAGTQIYAPNPVGARARRRVVPAPVNTGLRRDKT